MESSISSFLNLLVGCIDWVDESLTRRGAVLAIKMDDTNTAKHMMCTIIIAPVMSIARTLNFSTAFWAEFAAISLDNFLYLFSRTKSASLIAAKAQDICIYILLEKLDIRLRSAEDHRSVSQHILQWTEFFNTFSTLLRLFGSFLLTQVICNMTRLIKWMFL